MRLLKDYVRAKVKEMTMLSENRDFQITTDGKFIWVNYINTCILRLKFSEDVKVDLTDVKTYFKFGMIDGSVTAYRKKKEVRKWTKK